MIPSAYDDIPVLGVGETIALCNSLLNPLKLSVEGEVANYGLNKGKFVFFDLKDVGGESRLSCFQMIHQQNTPIEDGMRIVVKAEAGLYAKSGQFRLSVYHIELLGEGALKRSFELLKAKLASEGLFDVARKRPLPAYPKTVGIISSKEAAGYGDFIRIAQERSAGLHLITANVAVQGVSAEREIIAAFDYLNSYHQPDVIVLIRGGGSMEDLHAFNSEGVARAITRSKSPVVVGVGHERDVTIADFCADVRAATPSNAAQIVIPDKKIVMQEVQASLQRQHSSLKNMILTKQHRVAQIVQSLSFLTSSRIQSYQVKVQGFLTTIEALAPSQVLARGYTITTHADGKRIHHAKELREDEIIHTHFTDSTITSRITPSL